MLRRMELWQCLGLITVIVALGALACTREVLKEVPVEVVVEKEVIREVKVPGETVVVEKEVVKEVQVEVVVEKEVVKEVQVPGETVVVEKEVIKEVRVPGETVVVEKEVIKEVRVPGETVVVEKEVVKEVQVEVVVEKEVIKEVIKEVVVEKEVIKEVIKEVTVEVERKDEKTITVAKGAPSTFMPHNARSSTMLWAYHLAFSYLLAPNPATNAWDPDLAERWEVAPDGKSWTFYLRKNAVWEDGMPVTSEDVAFTIKSYLTPATVSRFLSHLEGIVGGLEYIDGKSTDVPGIVVVDDYTVRVDLKDPDAFFPLKLTGVAGHSSVPILPAHLLGDVDPDKLVNTSYFSEKPITSGAFLVNRFKPGEVVEYVANPDYYFGKPKIDRIFQRTIRSRDAVQIGLRRGEIDLAITGFAPEILRDFLTDTKTTVIGAQGNVLTSWVFNNARPEVSDPRLHQAFQMAVDRQAIIDTFYAGNGTIHNVGMTHAWYAKPEWDEAYPYDPDRAKALLAEMGWDSNKKVDFLTLPLTDEQTRAEVAAYQQYLAEAGINIEIRELDSAAHNKEFQARNWDLARGGYGLAPDPDGWVTNRYSLLGTNLVGYANDELEEQILRGRRGFTLEERAMVYQEMTENYLLKDLPIMGQWVNNRQYVKSERFIMPLWEGFREPTSLDGVPIVSTFIGKDWWDYQIEKWDVEEGRIR